jgi:NADPH:quinone reductase-like Zn-dependent oxidoreductase
MSIPKFHKAVVTVAPRAPLELIAVPTPIPKENEIRVRGEWTASTPLDLHQADGGLLVTHPQVLGDGLVGTVVEIGAAVKSFKVGDRVLGFSWAGQGSKAHQEFTVGDERLFGKVSYYVSFGEGVLGLWVSEADLRLDSYRREWIREKLSPFLIISLRLFIL